MRELINSLLAHHEGVNDSFGKKDADANRSEYEKLRALIVLLQEKGCKVRIEEIWESGLVSCSVEIEGVKF